MPTPSGFVRTSDLQQVTTLSRQNDFLLGVVPDAPRNRRVPVDVLASTIADNPALNRFATRVSNAVVDNPNFTPGPNVTLAVSGSTVTVSSIPVLSIGGNPVTNPNLIAGANINLNVSGSDITISSSGGGGGGGALEYVTSLTFKDTAPTEVGETVIANLPTTSTLLQDRSIWVAKGTASASDWVCVHSVRVTANDSPINNATNYPFRYLGEIFTVLNVANTLREFYVCNSNTPTWTRLVHNDNFCEFYTGAVNGACNSSY